MYSLKYNRNTDMTTHKESGFSEEGFWFDILDVLFELVSSKWADHRDPPTYN